MPGGRDPTLDALVELDGQVLVVDSAGGYWVRFVVTQVPSTSSKPHGLDYSFTLHASDGTRLAGFDNAHPVVGQKHGEPQDHRHRFQAVRPYQYKDAGSLISDFWKLVDSVLRERGVLE